MSPSQKATSDDIQEKSPSLPSHIFRGLGIKRESPAATTRTEEVTFRVNGILQQDPKIAELVAFLVKARQAFNDSKEREHPITLPEEDQDKFFILCNACFGVEDAISKGNPIANIAQIKGHLYRIGTGVRELGMLCGVKKV